MAHTEIDTLRGHLSLAEIEAGLAAAGPSPRDNGALEMIVRRPEVGARETVERAELDPAHGLLGDNWRARGSKATADGSAHPEMQITLTNTRLLGALAPERARWPLAGDQLYVDLDLSAENLPPGQRLAVGAAILEVSTVPHTGCQKFSERFGQAALRFVNSAEGRQARRRGVNARVLRGGAIGVGDVVRKVESEIADDRPSGA
jgi:hypothetical protein